MMKRNDANARRAIYPADIDRTDGTEWVITLPDWPEVAGGASGFEAALTDVTGALEEAALARLDRGEPIPEPGKTGTNQVEVGLTPFAMLKIALNDWARAYGRGAQAELARRTGLDKKTIAQAFAPARSKVSTDRLVYLAGAAGLMVSTEIRMPEGFAEAS